MATDLTLSNFLVGQIGYLLEQQNNLDSIGKARTVALAEVNRVLHLLLTLDEQMCDLALNKTDYHETHWHTVIIRKVGELRAVKGELEYLLTQKQETNG